jgi:taurine dioxygenase
MEIKRLSGALGAEISGIDLALPLGGEAVAAIRQAFLDHLVIFFRDQPLTPAQFMAFARRMGAPVEYPFVKGIDGFPEVIEVKKLEHERHHFGGIWHSDTAYL